MKIKEKTDWGKEEPMMISRMLNYLEFFLASDLRLSEIRQLTHNQQEKGKDSVWRKEKYIKQL